MWDLELGQEIILMTAIISVIAWFMGRTLCTSKADQIRSMNKHLKQENKRLEKLLEENESGLYQSNQLLKVCKKDIIDIKYQHNLNYVELDNKHTINIKSLNNLKKEHDNILKELQKIQGCQVKFEQLSKQHEEQSLEYIIIEDVLKNTQKDLRNSRADSKKYKHQSAYHQNENKQRSQDNSEQLEKISILKVAFESTKISLEKSNAKIRIKNNEIADFESKNQYLDESYQAEVKKKQRLKESLKNTEKQLSSSINLTDKQKDSLDKCQRQCNELKYEIKTYKILSTIG